MKRIWMLQKTLRRSRWTESLGAALFWVLLAVLLISVYTGVCGLSIS